MTIKGAWIYKELPEASTLQASLDAVLRPYPQLLGVYDAKQKSMLWDGREKPIGLVELDCRENSVAEDMYALVPEFNANGFKGGKSRALEAYRITLCDGAAVVLQGAHALMDGYTFYRIAGDWGKITSGTPVDAMTVDQTLLPDAGALTKEQALCRVQDLGWSRLGFKSIFRMLLNMATMKLIRETCTLEVSQDELSRMRDESGAGVNAVLCHFAISRLLEKFPTKERFTLIEVADLRGRACNMPEGFCGNFSQAVVIGDFGTGLPLRAQQAMLPGMIKFWQPEPEGPVQIIYGGYAAKIMRRK